MPTAGLRVDARGATWKLTDNRGHIIKPGRLSIPAEIGLLLACGAAAGFAAIVALANCQGQTGDGFVPGDKISAVCAFPAPQDWFLAGVGAAAAIALIGVLNGHARDSRRPALIGASISIALNAFCVIAGFAFDVVRVS